MDPAPSCSSKHREHMTAQEDYREEEPLNRCFTNHVIKEQSFENLVFQDFNTLKEKNITYEQIADFLQGLIDKTEALHSQKEKDSSYLPCIAKIYAISIHYFLEYQKCPFSKNNSIDCEKKISLVNFRVKNLVTGEYFSFPSFLPHFIEKHHFFQVGASRIDPAQLIDFFNLQPNVNYKIEKKEKINWAYSIGVVCSEMPENFKIRYEKYQIFQDDCVQVFLVPANQKIIVAGMVLNKESQNKHLVLFSKSKIDQFGFKKDDILFESSIYQGIALYEKQISSLIVLDEVDGYISSDCFI